MQRRLHDELRCKSQPSELSFKDSFTALVTDGTINNRYCYEHSAVCKICYDSRHACSSCQYVTIYTAQTTDTVGHRPFLHPFTASTLHNILCIYTLQIRLRKIVPKNDCVPNGIVKSEC
jgi:hypothetical protein